MTLLHKSLLLVIVVTFTVVLTWCGAGGESLRGSYLERAIASAERWEFERSIQQYELALEEQPTYDGWVWAWIVYYALEQYTKAGDAFEQAYLLDNTRVEAYLNLGVLFADQGEYQDALLFFDEALKRSPNDLDIVYNKATALSDLAYTRKQRGWSDHIIIASQALALFRDIIEQQPDNIDAITFAWITHYDVWDYEDALPYLEQAQAADPTALSPSLYLARTHKNLKDYDLAISYYEQTLNIAPGNFQAQEELNDTRILKAQENTWLPQ